MAKKQHTHARAARKRKAAQHAKRTEAIRKKESAASAESKPAPPAKTPQE